MGSVRNYRYIQKKPLEIGSTGWETNHA
jgi:hypothetical protein